MRSLSWMAAAVLGVLPLAAAEKKERAELDPVLFDADLSTRPMEDLQGEDKKGFEWLSDRKEGLRAGPGSYRLCGKDVGEVVMRGSDDRVEKVSVSIYNRGDDGLLRRDSFDEQIREWRQLLDDKLKVRSKERRAKGAVSVEGFMWVKGDSAYLLESSWNRSEKRAEFIRLRVASVSAAKQGAGRTARRRTLDDHVKGDDDGFTWIDGIPMVDQGEKGYCVVATVERVARYFGLEVDQHEMAQLANTDEGGTSGDDMEKAFQRVTGKIHVRTIKLIEYDNRRFEKDVKTYNREAKKQGAWTYDIDFDEYYGSPRYFWSKADPDIFRGVKASQNRYDHFNRKVKEYVDQGVPLCWTLFLGMFKEADGAQRWGGHMRLITGYNFDDPANPRIYYTDSWGQGHEKKTMRSDEAYCMTMALYAMVPTQ